jgi:hypothetical protein
MPIGRQISTHAALAAHKGLVIVSDKEAMQ